MKTLNRMVLSLACALFSICSSGAEPGSQAPDFQLNSLANASSPQVRLGDYRGKVIYLDFWASWCGPCQRSFPALEQLRQKFAARGFEVVAINLDENSADAMSFLKQHPVSFPIAQDSSGKIGETYGLTGMPSAYLLDSQGKVVRVIEGFDGAKEVQALEVSIQQLLGH